MIHAVRAAHLPQRDSRIGNSNLSRVIPVVLGGYVGQRCSVKYQQPLAPGQECYAAGSHLLAAGPRRQSRTLCARPGSARDHTGHARLRRTRRYGPRVTASRADSSSHFRQRTHAVRTIGPHDTTDGERPGFRTCGRPLHRSLLGCSGCCAYRWETPVARIVVCSGFDGRMLRARKRRISGAISGKSVSSAK